MAITVTEQQRQKYLDAMGVQPWFSRYRFPAAPVAKACAWPEALESSPILSEPIPSSSVAAPTKEGVSSLKSILAAPESNALPAPTPNVANATVLQGKAKLDPDSSPEALPASALPKPTVNPELEGPMPHARIFVVPIGDEGLVVGELPFLGEAFSRYHLDLLSDLLRACKRLPDQPLIAHHFQWPVCEALVAPYGLAGGVEALQGFLRNQHAFDRREWLLLLGTQAAQLTLASVQSFELLRGLSTFEGKRCLVTHGLTQLMRLPPLKLEAWQDLQSFIGAADRS